MKAVTMMLRKQPQSLTAPLASAATAHRPFHSPRVDGDDKVQRGAETQPCEEGEAGQDGQSLALSLRAVGRHAEPHHHGQGAEG